MPVAEARVRTAAKILLPEDVQQHYDALVTPQKNLDQVFSDRLTECVNHTAEKPLYFDDEDRRDLEKLLAANLSSTNDALSIIRRSVTAVLRSSKEGPITVTLDAQLVSQLRSRCPMHTPFGPWIEGLMRKWLTEFSQGVL